MDQGGSRWNLGGIINSTIGTSAATASKGVGEYKYFSVAENEELLGFHGYIGPLGMTSLGIVKWTPPVFG